MSMNESSQGGSAHVLTFLGTRVHEMKTGAADTGAGSEEDGRWPVIEHEVIARVDVALHVPEEPIIGSDFVESEIASQCDFAEAYLEVCGRKETPGASSQGCSQGQSRPAETPVE